MQRFKLGFRNCSGPQQLAICKKQIDAFARLPEKHRKDIDVAGLRETVAAARDSHQRIQQLRADLKHAVASHKAHLRNAREEVTRASWTALVNVKAEPQAMTEAGLPLKRSWQKAGVPAAPQNLRARPTAIAGEVRLDCKRPLRRCRFEWQRTTDPKNENGWQLFDGGIQQSCVVPGLVSGTEYYFRVRAANVHGKSPWSNLATARVK